MVDIAVRILEPGELQAVAVVDVALAPQVRQAVIVLEGHPLRLQRLDDFVELVADAPGDAGRLVRPRELRGVHQERRAAAPVVDDGRPFGRNLLQAELVLIEPPRRREVFHRYGGGGVFVSQHVDLLGPAYASGAARSSRTTSWISCSSAWLLNGFLRKR